MTNSRLRIAGIIALVLAGLSWLAEMAFYGDIDPNGVLQESFFSSADLHSGCTGRNFDACFAFG